MEEEAGAENLWEVQQDDCTDGALEGGLVGDLSKGENCGHSQLQCSASGGDGGGFPETAE